MERWVGWGVIAHDLRAIAQHQVDRVARQAWPTARNASRVATEQA
jgi:hypothetical protein